MPFWPPRDVLGAKVDNANPGVAAAWCRRDQCTTGAGLCSRAACPCDAQERLHDDVVHLVRAVWFRSSSLRYTWAPPK